MTESSVGVDIQIRMTRDVVVTFHTEVIGKNDKDLIEKIFSIIDLFFEVLDERDEE